MSAYLIAFLIPMLQEPTELKWNLKKDQVFTCAWSHHVKTATGKTDVRFELAGELVVKQVSLVGADAVFSIDKLILAPKGESKVPDVHFENGKLVKPQSPGENERNIAEWCTVPVDLRITPWGGHTLTEPHFIKVLFESQTDCFGTHLPDKPVKTGATWERYSETLQSQAMKLRPVKVNCKLASLKNDVATIIVDERQELKSGRFKLDFRTISEARFHPTAGYCSYYSIETTSTDMTERREPPDQPDSSVSMKFEMKPKK